MLLTQWRWRDGKSCVANTFFVLLSLESIRFARDDAIQPEFDDISSENDVDTDAGHVSDDNCEQKRKQKSNMYYARKGSVCDCVIGYE